MTLSPEAEALLPKKRPRQLSGASNLTTPNSHQPTKRFRSGVEAVAEQGADTGGCSYSRAVTSGGQHLIVNKKEAEEDPMEQSDLREVQRAIDRTLLKSDPGFLVRIERTYLHEGKAHVVCRDEKTLEWAKQVVLAIETTSGHPGYEARGP